MSDAESLAEALEREHREIDEGIEEFAAGLPTGEIRTEPMSRAMAALRRHIYLEEEFLFPPLRTAGLIAPVFVMVREHGEMWRVLDEIDEQLAAGGPSGELLDACRALTGQLQAHNPKEEQILYPQADTVLAGPASDELHAFLISGTTPVDWVCEGARG